MTDDRWTRVNALFHEALDQPDEGREAFLVRACGDDTALREEVRSLLAAGGRTTTFLEAGIDPARPAVGHYRIERVIGRGGMGVVYLAFDTRLGRRVALKAISPDYTHDPAKRERLRREARAAAGLAHPGIATVYALEEFGGEMFIAAEYVPGETLREEIARGPAQPGRAIDTVIALAAALAAAHDRGVVHRDLKPENVIRTSSGGIKILDFGLAQMTLDSSDEMRLTAHGRVIGTPAYMAPEQIRREPCDGRTDLFAAGVVLFELLTGAHPFAGADTGATLARILESSPDLPAPAPDDADRGLRERLGAILRRCLAKSPDARFNSAHALLAALETARRGGTADDVEPASAAAGAMRWWEFHQGATCFAYAALMVPLWIAGISITGRAGQLVFLVGLLGTVAAVVLRLHLWFAASSLPDEWRAQRARSHPWLRTAEWALVTALVVGGGWIVEARPAIGATLLSASVAVALSLTVIEPATTRAAFKKLP